MRRSNSCLLTSDCPFHFYCENLFKGLGEVVSLFVKVDKTQSLPFAFVCFKNNSEANLAYKQLANADPFACGTNLYVNWA